MSRDSLIGLKLRFGKYNWKIINWEANGCMLLCDVLDGNQFFRQAWDRSYRLDVGEDVAWPKCELHDWLNDDFMKDAFSEEESACIVNEPCRIGDFTTDQVGVFLLPRSDLIKHTNIHVDYCWTLDADVWDYDEEAVTNEKYVQPVIWIDFAFIDSLIPGWKDLAAVLAYSDDGDFGIPCPVLFYKELTEDYNLAIGNLIKMLECVSRNARKYYYEQIYEIMYVMARNDDAASINRVFELCPDLEPEGYYSYDQMLPLGEAIEKEAYGAINALVNNGCNIDCASMDTHTTIHFASSDKMVLFLIERGVTVEFSDIMDIWVWEENPELAKKVIQMTASSNIQQYIDCARYYYEDTSIYCYGGLEEKERQAFNNMIAYFAEIKNALDCE